MIKKSKKIINLFIIFALVFVTTCPFKVKEVKAERLIDYKNKVAELESQKAEADALTNEAKQNIEKKSQAIKDANNTIILNEQRVEEAKQKVAESQEEIKIKQEELKDVLVSLQYSDLNPDEIYTDYIFSASSISEMMERQAVVEQVVNYTQEQLNSLDELIEDNEELQVKLANDNVTLNNSITSYETQLEELHEYVDKQASIGMGFADQIKAQKNMIKLFEEAGCKDNDDVEVCYFSKMEGSGSFSRPLTKGKVTQAYNKTHAGIDLGGNPEGTPVYAPASGTVIYVARKTSCGGNIVYMHALVDGKKYTVEMAHLLSIKVSSGQKVSKGQIIGTVGGYSTSHALSGGYDYCTYGAHLHYAISYGYFFSESGRTQWNKFKANTGATSVQSISGIKSKKGWKWTTRG